MSRKLITHPLIEQQTPGAALNALAAVKLPPGRKSFGVYVQTTATVKIQASVDGTNFVDVASLTASGVFEIDSAIPYWRANNSAHSAGAIAASVSFTPDQDG